MRQFGSLSDFKNGLTIFSEIASSNRPLAPNETRPVWADSVEKPILEIADLT